MFPSTKSLAAIAVISATFARVTEAQCVAARTYLHNRPFIDDVITMELWHSGRKVCSERASAFFADNEDFYQWDCPDLDEPRVSWRVKTWENGQQLEISTMIGEQELKAYDIENKDTDYNDWCDAWTDNGCKARASSYESCHWISSVCTNDMTYCTLCGVPFTRSLNDAWIENVRAVWIEGTSWNRTAVSGVGRWGEYDDDPCVPVPTGRQTRYDSHSGPGPNIEVGLAPGNPTVYLNPDAADEPWGYGFHESCCCFRSLEAIPQTFRSDPYHVPGLVNAINGAARLQNDVLSHLEPTVQSLQSDNVRSLRLASPVFATLELSERFWASRFQPGHEFEHLPEVHDRPPESWRDLYLFLKIWARGIPSMANRQRVWGLAKRLQATLTQLDGVSCQGSALGTWFETTPDGPDQNMPEAEASWHTASRAVASPGKSFFYGSRVLRARALYFPEPVKLRQMSVSFVDTAAGRFISGFNMIDEHDRSHALGYQHGNAMWRISLPLDEPIQGWELAMNLSGIKGIAAVQSDGKLTSWAGESAGLPRWRLKEAQGVSAVKAEFDNWLNNCLWYPEVPKEGLLFNGSRGDKPRPKYNLPVITVFFGESDDRYLSQLSEIVVWVFDICHVAGVEFRFTDSSYNRQLGYVGLFDKNYPARRNCSDSYDSTVSFSIDGSSGERLSSIEVQTKGTYVVGLKIRGNLDRSIQTPDYPYGTDKGWVTVHGKGSQIIGMFASLARPFWDLGLISV
ncbi:uncharacterized protein FOBCDRAFT_246175 [Fusarium oxysporum Fo47]|uniref:uncharacterized protein n=1 Tax=Fusarium oxysporum Fo47 TaxID=660027 RepID=UPI002869D93A|nr:uncharacterized protein FOBCDRAFT_246175 [Fusarium oxysporum Fo47]WJG37355.1 hypothetical protein FOBCDRAFT_246175 [Fusarium oxysporum Fo47]